MAQKTMDIKKYFNPSPTVEPIVQERFDVVNEEVEDIKARFEGFLDGTRVFLLMLRSKDGGHNKEFKRRAMTFVSHSVDQAEGVIRKLLILKNNSVDPYRLYVTLNSRNLVKAERNFKKRMLEMDFNNDENKKIFYERLEHKWMGCMMEPSARETSFFMIDIDNDENGKSTLDEAIKAIPGGVKVFKTYKTKNGYHAITAPFNPILYTGPGEVKKDAQLLLSF
jgi:hypothetical protein